MPLPLFYRFGLLLIGACCLGPGTTEVAQAQRVESAPSAPFDKAKAREAREAVDRKKQDKLDAAFAKMLRGATLEGSFTSTGAGRDATELKQEKYTIVEAKKLADNIWLITARIQYGEHDATLPITVPIRWAGDTPGDHDRQHGAAGVRHGIGAGHVFCRSLRRLLEARRARRPFVRRDSPGRPAGRRTGRQPKPPRVTAQFGP
jgi:hypothetical protein